MVRLKSAEVIISYGVCRIIVGFTSPSTAVILPDRSSISYGSPDRLASTNFMVAARGESSSPRKLSLPGVMSVASVVRGGTNTVDERCTSAFKIVRISRSFATSHLITDSNASGLTPLALSAACSSTIPLSFVGLKSAMASSIRSIRSFRAVSAYVLSWSAPVSCRSVIARSRLANAGMTSW